MSSTRNPGRVAGFLYLLLVVAAPLRLIYIPAKLFVHENATVTANNIAAHELLFRLGIVSDLFCGTILIFLVLALYRLFKGVDQNLAVMVVIVGGVMPAAIDFFNVLNDAAALMLVRGADFLLVGSMAFPLSDSCVQVALPAPLPGHLADHQRLRLSGHELYGLTFTSVRGCGF